VSGLDTSKIVQKLQSNAFGVCLCVCVSQDGGKRLEFFKSHPIRNLKTEKIIDRTHIKYSISYT